MASENRKNGLPWPDPPPGARIAETEFPTKAGKIPNWSSFRASHRGYCSPMTHFDELKNGASAPSATAESVLERPAVAGGRPALVARLKARLKSAPAPEPLTTVHGEPS